MVHSHYLMMKTMIALWTEIFYQQENRSDHNHRERSSAISNYDFHHRSIEGHRR